MSASRTKYRIAAFFRAARIWLLIALGLAALGWIYWFLATTGPKRVQTKSDTISASDDPALAKMSEEIDALEKQYRRAADANVATPESTAALTQAVEKQKELLRIFTKADLEQSTRLVRLETELGSVRAKDTVAAVDRLQKDGEELLNAGKPDEAGAKLREALRLQKEINLSAASSRYKNYVRETSLTQEVAAIDAVPLKKEMELALASARKAATEERWSDALAAYTVARDAQARINREYGRTRYADLAGEDRLSAEIESLNAAGIATEIEAREREGDEAIKARRPEAAAKLFTTAGDLQLQVNQQYPRSRFVSSQRIENLEIKRQTALSSGLADSLEQLDVVIGVHLRKRQIVAAEQKLAEAGQLVEKLFKDYPKSQRLDGALRIKFAYLALRRTDLRALQDEVYERLLPLPGTGERLLLKTEVPQSLYVLVMNTNPSRNPGRTMPVDSVSWTDAQEFCMRLSWLLGATARLPTPNEFRVALGGEGGDEAWSSKNSDGHSHETGRQKANASGFFDLLGNLGEWSAAEADADKAPVLGGSYLDEPDAIAKVPIELRLKGDRARHVGLRILVEL